jgi:T-complex protein 1 subunit zeta
LKGVLFELFILFSIQGCLIPGGGAFEIVAHQALTQYKEQVKGRARLGVQAFAEALLIIPKAIAQNAGHDQQETIVKLQHEYATSKIPVGIDVTTGLFDYCFSHNHYLSSYR